MVSIITNIELDSLNISGQTLIKATTMMNTS